MEIKYLGFSSFLVKTKTTKLVTDPFDPSIGIKFPKTEADIVTISRHEHVHDRASQVIGDILVIDMPGEFEKKDVRVFGYSGSGENTLYKIEAEDITVLHCGDLKTVLSDAFIDQVGKIDVLILPVGGVDTIDANQAVEVTKEIEPSIVIPMHYNYSRLNQKELGKLAPVSDFLKKIGAEGTLPIPKLTVKKDELGEEMKVVVME